MVTFTQTYIEKESRGEVPILKRRCLKKEEEEEEEEEKDDKEHKEEKGEDKKQEEEGEAVNNILNTNCRLGPVLSILYKLHNFNLHANPKR